MTKVAVAIGVAVAALAASPAASAAKPRLYHVSLSGKARSELTRTKTIEPPYYGCTGTVTRTDHFVASASLSPAPNAVPIRSYATGP